MQRLFSSFAHGAPGAGLLLLRLAASTCLVLHAASTFPSSVATVSPASTGLSLLTFAAALLLLVGLWTPLAGVLAGIAAAWHGVAIPGNLGLEMLLGSLGFALALLGPGAWSLDARLFGWKRLEIQDPTTTDRTPDSGRDDHPSF